ncbi:MAG: ribosomal RNA small subunit methyltransferase A [Desulfobulbaceae bacterium]|uniref:Ribosomal RNA small subunit methyltransferase A n=1 Tax=Candidatus Desulfobia pelagia TaxID=2841692 RepID=A0A8J6N9S2_9BACT|nr:ribosomal RNA small subunit methyltransferase A [Candidatus Desulfobia pelagia]
MNLQKIKEVLRHKQLAPLKKLGQNFLIYPETAARIVHLAGVTSEDTILELGVGLGTLTEPLAQKAKHVIGLEIDSGILAWQNSEGNLAENVTLIHQDLLKADFHDLAQQSGGKLKIVANLPYSISNPLLFKLMDHRHDMGWAVLMLQKEVGMRLIAKPGSKEYGIVSVLLSGCAEVSRLLDVGPGQFYPRPKIDSVVVKIQFHPEPSRAAALPVHDVKLLRQVVKGSFQQRRKTLVNALSSAPLLSYSKDQVKMALSETGIDDKVRAENLTVEDYVSICTHLSAL